MRIVFDNIIYSLQHYGGISVVWNNLVSRIAASGHEVQFVEYNDAERNISRHALELPKRNIVRGKSFMMPVRRYFNPKVSNKIFDGKIADPRYIFHSSYFRISHDPNAINITTTRRAETSLEKRVFMKETSHKSLLATPGRLKPVGYTFPAPGLSRIYRPASFPSGLIIIHFPAAWQLPAAAPDRSRSAGPS